MKIFNYLFPFKLYLTIFQLEEYKIPRFYKWLFGNFSLRKIPTKKGLVITNKVKLIIAISAIWFFIILAKNILVAFLFLFQPYFLYSLAILTLKPYEIYNKRRIIKKTHRKIQGCKNLKVIAVTGSYAKTSVKEILYQILKEKYPTLRTPESYNTIFGIAKVVDLELDASYDFFICELGAYKKGEIKELSRMVSPAFGIITGITQQHLERFGSFQNIISGKFELFEYLQNKNKMIFNLKDENIRKEVKRRKIDKDYLVKTENIQFGPQGSTFVIKIRNKKFKIQTELFGYAHVNNIEIAANAALMLGLSPEYIANQIKKLKPFANRLVLLRDKNSTVVDNTYNSNPAGFAETINTAKLVAGKKVLVTPGLVELGAKSSQFHEELGKSARGVFDEVILVGKNKRTLAFQNGLGKNAHVEFIKDTREEYANKINELKENFNWVFLENDVTENY